jgi:hypothetical protein
MLKISIIILITIFRAFNFNFAPVPRNFMTGPRRIRVERRRRRSERGDILAPHARLKGGQC